MKNIVQKVIKKGDDKLNTLGFFFTDGTSDLTKFYRGLKLYAKEVYQELKKYKNKLNPIKSSNH